MSVRLNPGQRAIWLAALADPLDPSVHVHRVLVVEADLSESRLVRAVGSVTQLVSALRASCRCEPGSADATIETADEIDCAHMVDVRSVATVGVDDLRRAIAQPFDLSQPGLLRVHALRESHERRTTLVIVAHHLVLDGIGFDLVVDELMLALLHDHVAGTPVRSAPQPVPARSRWLACDSQAWRAALEPLPSHSLPAMEPTGAPLPAVASVSRFSDGAFHAIDRLRMRLGLPVATILMGMFTASLHKILDMPDLIAMTQVDTRTRESRREPGMFVNTLPVRSSLKSDDDWVEHLRAIHAAIAHALKRRYEPLESIVTAIGPHRRPDRSTIFTDFEFSVVRRWRPPAQLDRAGLEVWERFLPDPGARFGVSMNPIVSTDQVLVRWALSSRLFVAADVATFDEALEMLCRQAVSEPASSPARAQIVSPAACREILELGTGRSVRTPVEAASARFLARARRMPDAVAVRDGGACVTYSQLQVHMSSVALTLSRAGVSRGDRVAVCCPRGLPHVAALLAILHLGAVYVPIDPINPWRRVRGMLDEVKPVVALVDRAASSGIFERIARGEPLKGGVPMRPTGRERGCGPRLIDAGSAAMQAAGILPPAASVRGEDPAYIIFTSGSTGRPKGVEVGVLAMLNHLHMTVEEFELSASDSVAQTADLGFDIHIWQALAPLWVGGEVHVYDRRLLIDAEALLTRLAQLGTTVVELVPSHLAALLRLHEARTEQGAPWELALRLTVSTGEALPGELARELARVLAEVAVKNAYGPAEAADDVAFADVVDHGSAREAWSVPIGWPARNAELMVLDRWRSLRPLGWAGELVIAGTVLARGYVGHRGAEAFGRHPYRSDARAYWTGDRGVLTREDGFRCLGRNDGQIKLSGRRVELGEIEAALGAMPGVLGASALPVVDGARTVLAAFVAARDGLDARVVREWLRERLPAYMVPSTIRVLDALPLGPNGKVDRAALRSLLTRDRAEVAGSASEPAVEDELGAMVREQWAAVLPDTALGLDESFFAAGGDSLSAADLMARLRVRGVSVAIATLFEHQELGSFLAAVREGRPNACSSGMRRTFPATPRQQEMLDAVARGAGAPALSVILDVSIEPALLAAALQTIVRRNPELRYAFTQSPDGAWSFRVLEDPQPRSGSSGSRPRAAATAQQIPHGRRGSPQALASVAGQLDARAGCHVAFAHAQDGSICLAISHLVCDLVGLRYLVATLDELLGATGPEWSLGDASGVWQDGTFAAWQDGTFAAWADELARRSLVTAASRTGSYLPEVTAVTRELSAAAARMLGETAASADCDRPKDERSSRRDRRRNPELNHDRRDGRRLERIESGRSWSERIEQHWPRELSREHVRTVALATLASALGSALGVARVRVDLDVDGREAFASAGLRGDGMGCFTLLAPVIVQLVEPVESLLAEVELALAASPPGATWDSGARADRECADADLSAVPLLNLVGDSLRLPACRTLGAVRVTEGLAEWNASADTHGLVVDVVFATVAERSSLEYRVTAVSAGGIALAAPLAERMRVLADGVSAAACVRARRGQPQLPAGLELLDVGAAELRRLAGLPTPATGASAIAVEPLEEPASPQSRIEAIVPLTASQRGILVEVAGRPGLYTSQQQVELVGPLELGRLASAWRAVCARHQALRASLLRYDAGVLQMVVAEPRADAMTVHDLQGELDLDRAAAAICEEHARSATDPWRGPWAHLAVLARGERIALLCLTHQHVGIDGRSLQVLLGDLARAYDGADIADAGSGSLLDAMRTMRLEQAVEPPPSSVIQPASLATFGPARVAAETVERGVSLAAEPVRFLASEHRVTEASVVIAAWCRTLASVRGEPNAVCVLTRDLRPRLHHDAVGMLSDACLVVLPVAAADSLFQTVRAVMRGLAGQSSFPSLGEGLRTLRRAGASGRPDCLITVYRGSVLPIAPRGLDWRLAGAHEPTEFAIDLTVRIEQTIRLDVAYDRTRVADGTLERLLERMASELSGLSLGHHPAVGTGAPVAVSTRPPAGARASVVRDRVHGAQPVDRDTLASLVAIAAELLGRPLTEGEDLYASGLDSLGLVELVSCFSERGYEVSLSELLDVGSLEGLQRVRRIDSRSAGNMEPKGPAEVSANATELERSLLEMTEERAVGWEGLHEQSLLVFGTLLDPARMREALQLLMSRLPSLGRRWVVVDGARQLAHRVDGELEFESLRSGRHSRARRLIERIAAEDLCDPYQASGRPLMRFRLACADEETALLISFHAAILDGWSFGTFVRDLQRAYRGLGSGDEPAGQDRISRGDGLFDGDGFVGCDSAEYRAWCRRYPAPVSAWRWRLRDLRPIERPAPAHEQPCRAVAQVADPVMSRVRSLAARGGVSQAAVLQAAVGRAAQTALGMSSDRPMAIRMSLRGGAAGADVRTVGQLTADIPVSLNADDLLECAQDLADSVALGYRAGYVGAAAFRSLLGCGAGQMAFDTVLVMENYFKRDEVAVRSSLGVWPERWSWRRDLPLAPRAITICLEGDRLLLELAGVLDLAPETVVSRIAELVSRELAGELGGGGRPGVAPMPARSRGS